MSASAAATGALDPEAEYYQAVEEYFVSRRGDPLLLSSSDWLLIRRWRCAGIPLRIVLRGIRDALDGHAHSWGRASKVRSLRYCEREVKTASERWRRAVRLGQDGELSPARHLSSLAQALRERQDLPAAAASACADIAAEIEHLVDADLEPAALERRLQQCEKLLLKAARAALSTEGLIELEADVERAFAPYRDRMPEAVLAQVRREALTRGVLERFGLPRLTLFHAS